MNELPIEIVTDTCVRCGLCVKACPFGAITQAARKEVPVIDLDKCTLCGACVEACKFDAIILRKKAAAAGKDDLSAYRDVWVFAEQHDGVIQSVTYELLGEGRKLADELGMKLCAVLLGHNVQPLTQALTERGADIVYSVDKPELAYYQDEAYAAVMVELIRRHKPNVLLCGATTVGRSLVSRVAVPVRAGLTADCTGLAIDPKTKDLLQTRPAFGGNIMATIMTPNARPQMATVRPKVMKEAVVTAGRTGQVKLEDVAQAILQFRARRIRFEQKPFPDQGFQHRLLEILRLLRRQGLLPPGQGHLLRQGLFEFRREDGHAVHHRHRLGHRRSRLLLAAAGPEERNQGRQQEQQAGRKAQGRSRRGGLAGRPGTARPFRCAANRVVHRISV